MTDVLQVGLQCQPLRYDDAISELVEEAAAAGKSMDNQTQQLVQQVGFFKADEESRRAA